LLADLWETYPRFAEEELGLGHRPDRKDTAGVGSLRGLGYYAVLGGHVHVEVLAFLLYVALG